MSRLIDADAFKKKIRKDYHPMDEIPFFDVMHLISNAPTIEERPKGMWIGDTDYESYQGCYEAYKCNRCGYSIHWREYYDSDVPKNFCPDCGADMRGYV